MVTLVTKGIKKYDNMENITKHSETSEKEIEKYLSRRVKEMGGIALKYSNQNRVGYPDRLVCLHNGKVVWVELKSKGKKQNLIQVCRQKELEAIGHKVYVIDNKPAIDELIKEWRQNDL